MSEQFETLPDGYEIRRDRVLTSAKTTRKMTLGGDAALYEIASASPRWTEWGEGHSTSMYSGACERRGYIEVAVHKSKRLLFRATREGVLLANRWRKERGEEPLPVPPAHEHEWSEWEHAYAHMHPVGYERRYCECGSFQSRVNDARGEEWPENLTSWDLHEAILVEPDRDRLEMLNAELRARLDAGALPGRWLETPGGVAAALNRYDRIYNPSSA